MWKLVHQFRIFIIILVIVPLSSQALSGTIVLRVSQSIYDLETIKQDYILIEGFACMYPNSLLVKMIGLDGKDDWIKEKTKLKKPMKKVSRKTFNKMIRFYKMREYIKGKQIYLTKSLSNLLSQSYKLNACKTQGLFHKEKITQALSYMAKLEVLFSNRKKRLSRFDEKKLDESLGFIYSTINDQFTHEFLWD